MAAERFGGVKINIDSATDDEVLNIYKHSLERLERAQDDVDRLLGHMALRVGETSLDDTQEFEAVL